jgi:hypothetical protein
VQQPVKTAARREPLGNSSTVRAPADSRETVQPQETVELQERLERRQEPVERQARRNSLPADGVAAAARPAAPMS